MLKKWFCLLLAFGMLFLAGLQAPAVSAEDAEEAAETAEETASEEAEEAAGVFEHEARPKQNEAAMTTDISLRVNVFITISPFR